MTGILNQVIFSERLQPIKPHFASIAQQEKAVLRRRHDHLVQGPAMPQDIARFPIARPLQVRC
jgi:hypothetical protein